MNDVIYLKSFGIAESEEIDSMLKLQPGTSYSVFAKIKELYGMVSEDDLFLDENEKEDSLLTELVSSRIQEYRDLFSYTNTGRRGLNSSKNECVDKAKRVIKIHNVTIDDIIDTADNYVSECLENNSPMFTSGNFLEKYSPLNKPENPIMRWM